MDGGHVMLTEAVFVPVAKQAPLSPDRRHAHVCGAAPGAAAVTVVGVFARSSVGAVRLGVGDELRLKATFTVRLELG